MPRALIVDDRAENLYLLHTLLAGHGFDVDEARHGAEALARARLAPPDLVISDLLMPVMDGFMLLRNWKADDRLRSVPFVVYTATYTDPKDERLARDLGADEFILKPSDPDVFMQRMLALLDRAERGQLDAARPPAADDSTSLRTYRDVVVAKLEHKTEQLEEANRRLQATEKRYRSLFENHHAVMLVVDPTEGRIVDANPAAAEYYGWSRDELRAMKIAQINTLSEAEVKAEMAAARAQRRLLFHFLHRRADGEVREVEVRSGPVFIDGREMLLSVITDETEQRRAARALARITRLHAMLSATNQLLVRATDRQSLFDGICRIAVSEGGFRFAWLGVIGSDGAVEPAARAGDDRSELDTLRSTTAAGGGLIDGPTLRSLFEGRHVVRDALPATARADARAAAIFPLRAGGRVIGCLSLYSAEDGFFGHDELATLDDMAADVSYGLDSLAREEALATAAQVVEASPVVAFRLRPERGWPVEYVSSNVARWGYTAESFMTGERTIADIVHPDDLPRVKSEIERLLGQGRREYRQVYRIRTADGMERWVEDATAITRDAGGKFERFQGTITDITERHRAEQAVLTAMTQYRTLFDANPHPMWVYELDTLRFLAVNDAAVARYGYSREEFLAMTIADIRPAEDVGRLLDSVAQVRDGSLDKAGIWRHRRRDGAVIDVEITSHAIDFFGKRAEIVLAHDVTERLRTEREAQRAARLVETAGTLARLGGWEVDLRTDTVVWSDEVCRIHDLPPGTKVPVEQGISFYAPEWRARISEVFAACARDGRPYDEELEIITARGRRVWVRAVGRAVRDEQGSIVGVEGAFQDISERKAGQIRIDLQNRRAQALLELPGDLERLSEAEFLQRGQALAEELTASGIAFIHFLGDDEQTIRLVSWSQRTLAGPCGSVGDPHHAVSEAGIWADAVRRRAPVVCNDYAGHPGKRGLPDGHAALERLLTVPVIEDGRVVMLTGVGNKPQDYTDLDVETVQLIANEVWRLVRRRHDLLALEQSEARFHAAFEQAAVGVALMAPDGRWLDANRRLCELLGRSREALVGRSVQEVTLPEDFARQSDLVQRALAGEMPSYSMEKRYLRADGAIVWTNLTSALLRRPDGSPEYFVSVIEDITSRKRAEDAERKLSQAVEQSAESIVITNAAGAIEYVNDSFVEVSGYRREELIGRNPRVLKSGKTPKETYQQMWRALLAGRAWTGEFVNRRKDGTEYVEAAAITPLRQPDGTITHYVAVKEDITERRRIEQELERYRHELEDLVRQRTLQLEEARRQAEAANQAKSAFLANMSHEIRTPMNGVLGMLEVLARSRLSDDQRELLRTARDSGRTLLGIINDILDFSKIEAGRLEIERMPVAVADVVEELCDSLVPVASRKDVDLRVFVAPQIPEQVLTDPLRLRQILLNLVGNAIKFSGGQPGRRGLVTLRATPAPGTPLALRFAVSDNGIGMAPDVVERLFTPFTQAEASTTRRFGGSGLGLTICKRLADLMQGSISVDSEAGVGSTFVVTLPCPAVDAPARRVRPDLSGITCLVLESAELDVDGLCAYLEHAGARVRRVATTAEGTNAAAELTGPVVAIRQTGHAHPTRTERLRGGHDVRHLFITRGRRRRARIEAPDVVTLDGAALRRDALLRAVAVAAGRASPEVTQDAAPAGAGPEHATPLTVEQARDRGELILVAEDDEVNRKVIRRQLQLLGRTAEMAIDGAEALRMWQAGRYGLVLTDLHMPEMDGYALTVAIRQQEADRPPGAPGPRRVPIVALTANALRGEADHAKSIGMDDYLTKPLQLDELRRALDRWLKRPDALSASPERPSVDAEPDAPAIDVAVLGKLVGGNEAMMREYLSSFRQTAGALRDQLHAACAARDPDTVRSLAHRLKSAARSIGAPALVDLCVGLEAAGAEHDLAAARACLPMFDAALHRVEAAIDVRLTTGPG